MLRVYKKNSEWYSLCKGSQLQIVFKNIFLILTQNQQKRKEAIKSQLIMFSIGHRNKQLKAAAPKMAFSATSLHESKEPTTEEAVQRLSWKNTDLTVSE